MGGSGGLSFFLLLFVVHDGMIMAAIRRAVHIPVMDGLFPDGKKCTAVSAMRFLLREAEDIRKKIPPYHLNRHVLPHGMEKKENGFLFGIPFIMERQTQAHRKNPPVILRKGMSQACFSLNLKKIIQHLEKRSYLV